MSWSWYLELTELRWMHENKAGSGKRSVSTHTVETGLTSRRLAESGLRSGERTEPLLPGN
jgi:hypothetical protein